jgi:hypothetical protein
MEPMTRGKYLNFINLAITGKNAYILYKAHTIEAKCAMTGWIDFCSRNAGILRF